MICGGFYFEVLLTTDCCVSPFLFFLENSAPLVIVISRLFIYFMFVSFKLLLFILFCISLAFSITFLEEMYSMSAFLYWYPFLDGLIIEVYFMFGQDR